MIETSTSSLRRAKERGYADHGWLKSYHSFSFADYHDPEHMNFGPLRVINEDWIAAAKGFGTHPHRDMEIITYILDGALEHKDSMGTGSVIRPGDVQRMSAGRGVLHSEFNHLRDEETHLLQIWIAPNVTGIAPSYEEKHFTADQKRGQLRLIASESGLEGSVVIHQNARIYAGLFDGGEKALYRVDAGRRIYLHVARGQVSINGDMLSQGDAAMLESVDEVVIDQGKNAEVLLFDLP